MLIKDLIRNSSYNYDELKFIDVLLSHITNDWLVWKIKETETDWLGLPISSIVMQGFLPNYRRILDDLIKIGIIESRKSFRIGENCNHYSINEEYLRGYKIVSGKCHFGLVSTKEFLNGHKTWKDLFEKWQSQGMSPQSHDRRNKQLEHLNIINKRSRYLSFSHITRVDLMNMGVKRPKQVTQSIRSISVGNFDFRTDKFNSRIYTPIHTLPSNVMKEVRWKGRNGDKFRGREIDIKSSQIQILSRFLQKEDIGDRLFYEKCNSGEIYEFFAEKLGCSRSEVKQPLLKWLYSDRNSKHLSRTIPKELLENITSVFKIYFPNTYRYLSRVNPTDLSEMLLTGEFDVMWGLIGKIREWELSFQTELRYVTKHDSIQYSEEDANVIERITEEYFNEVDIKFKKEVATYAVYRKTSGSFSVKEFFGEEEKERKKKKEEGGKSEYKYMLYDNISNNNRYDDEERDYNSIFEKYLIEMRN